MTSLVAVGSVMAASCQNDDYLQDGGVHNPYYNGTVLSYLKNYPDKNYFTGLVEMIHYAGMDKVFDTEGDTITFFAPNDFAIRSSVNAVSRKLYQEMGEDSIKDWRQIKPEVWKSVLSLYVIPNEKFLLKDIPQLDTTAVDGFPGKAMHSLNGRIMNMGTVYEDANGVKYAGYRHILYSYVNDFMSHDMENSYVATSDIQPVNGVIHVLNFVRSPFGFTQSRFVQQVINAGIIPLKEVQKLDKSETAITKEEDK